MKTDCGNNHKPDYSKSCCVKSLLELSELSENSTLYHKFAKLFLSAVNHANKNDSLDFYNFKIEMLNSFLDVMTKNMSHFFFLSKQKHFLIFIEDRSFIKAFLNKLKISSKHRFLRNIILKKSFMNNDKIILSQLNKLIY